MPPSQGEGGREVSRRPRLAGGVKRHNINEASCPGSPFDVLRAVSSVERSRAVGGELHIASGNGKRIIEKKG